MKKVLFVCLGNICRSPAAQGVMEHLVSQRGLSNEVLCDSAGTCAYHVGERADSRMRERASSRGITLTSISRQLATSDFQEFDYIIAMDKSNYRNIAALDSKDIFEDKIHMMTDFCTRHKVSEVPDPYYGGQKGFDLVLDIVTDGCEGLLARIEKEL